jgi:hypothetical protein
MILQDELAHPEKYAPIARGPWVALLIVVVLGTIVPFWVGYQKVKKCLK